MSHGVARPSAAELAELIGRGPATHELRIWQPLEGDRPASVLVPILATDDALRVLVTRRSAELTKHAGEFSFPGGRPEAHDADALATALREAHEEVGLPHDSVQVIGRLPDTTTYKTGYAITPFVGLITASTIWAAQPSEVAEVAEPKLADLVQARQVRRFERSDGASLDMPYFPLDSERQIWGATARILDELLRRLAPVLPGAASVYGLEPPAPAPEAARGAAR